MKLEEVIKINDKEYNIELNRASLLRIDKICNVKKTIATFNEELFDDYVEEIDDNYNPLDDDFSDEAIENLSKKKENAMKNLIEKSLFVWLYPNYKFPISKVKEIIAPYYEDGKDEEFNNLLEKVLDFVRKCGEVKDTSKN